MKHRTISVILIAVLALSIFTGCGKTEANAEPRAKQDVAVVADPSDRPVGEQSAKIYTIDPDAPVEIPEESVPLASTFEGRGEQITKREAEAFAISHAGLMHEQISFLYTKLLEDAQIPCYQVQFKHGTESFSILVDAATGEILGS